MATLKKTKNLNIVIAVIIGIALLASSYIWASALRENSKDISERQILDYQRELEREELKIQNQEDVKAENEEKRSAYLKCVSNGLKAFDGTSAQLSDVEVLRTLCKDKTGFVD